MLGPCCIQGDSVTKAERVCSSCQASGTEIAERGHRQLDGLGRPVAADTMTSTPCPEACSCIPEHFSMEEHEAYAERCEREYQAAKAKTMN